MLVNHGSDGSRFSEVRLADYGDGTHVDSVTEEHLIGATIFRSPEAILNLIWGPATDIS
jgi:casein kinase II subunit alpha